MQKRPDRCRCILTGGLGRCKTWCDEIVEYESSCSSSIDVAIFIVRRHGIPICPACSAAIIAAIEAGTWKPPVDPPPAKRQEG